MTDFDVIYQNEVDPWAIGTAWYERRKRTILMACLPQEGYRYALELGCGRGHTTAVLARRCDTVRAIDLSLTAVHECRRRMNESGITNAEIEQLRLPWYWPLSSHRSPDLLVVSELAYYFSDFELDSLIERCIRSLSIGGHWVMCHYRLPFHDRRQETDPMHEVIDGNARLKRVVMYSEESFRLDVWQRTGEV